ncbi:hypothetical protein NLJ89_g3578 [Agrocybe chaxingu]|uniref:Hikeshi-like domain-containing protein n=1 Tax=Agrocybe chaxingu TaxID=84603 RepID=A0A9W8K4H2_9AGAR|nr:hypothetical protein NLJ89_g3578 [Agrocybe chaxingu]
MFGCCVAGRLLQTNIVQVDETHAYFELPNASTINHVCVFLVGTVPFPDGFGAAVHFYWPGKGFQLLGMISNEKPSAIFRLRGAFNIASTSTAQDRFSTFSQYQQGQDVTAILGISIEPLDQIQAQLQSLQSSSFALVRANGNAPDATVLAERIVKNLLNYLSGFMGGGVGPEVLVPMNIIQRWYDAILGKIRASGVGFLENTD